MRNLITYRGWRILAKLAQWAKDRAQGRYLKQPDSRVVVENPGGGGGEEIKFPFSVAKLHNPESLPLAAILL